MGKNEDEEGGLKNKIKDIEEWERDDGGEDGKKFRWIEKKGKWLEVEWEKDLGLGKKNEIE